ncbi:hypothetical protein [Methylobacterium sp. CM6246]
MTDEPPSPEQLSEVLRLCTVLADRVFDAQMMGRTVPADHAVALAKAARFLQDQGVEWPPMLTHVMHELADKTDRPASEASDPGALPDVDLHDLTRFFAGFRKK